MKCSEALRRLAAAALAAVIMTGCAASGTAGNGSSSAAESAAAGETGEAGTDSPEAASDAGDASEAGQGKTSSGAAQDAGSADAAGSAAADEEEKVTVVIPTVYEDVKTQEEADEICRRNGYESAVLEEDGSLTIVMSRSVYDEMIRQYKESVDKGIAEITAGDSSIVKIEYNEDYSEFTVTVSEDELGIIERQAADELVMYGTLYQVYTGNDVDHITVNYVNGSGETVETADSGSLDSAY